MKLNKKVVLSIVCAVLMVATSVLGTIAYLTSQKSITNTFTVGNVEITLDETDVDENGEPVIDPDTQNPIRTEEGNEYHLIPGERFIKDPTITVLAGSEESYVRMIMKVYNASAVDAIIANPVHGLTDYADLFDGWDETKWLYEGFEKDDTNDIISFEFRYFEKVDGFDDEEKANDIVLEPLFTELVAPGTLTNEELDTLYGDAGDFKIDVEGHAIQTAGFNTEDEAWAAFTPKA